MKKLNSFYDNIYFSQNDKYSENRSSCTYVDIIEDMARYQYKDVFAKNNKINYINDVSNNIDNLKFNPILFLFYIYCIFHDLICFTVTAVIIVAAVYVSFHKLFTKKIKNYIYFISVVIFNCLSYYEVLSVLSCSIIILTFSTVSSFSEDDSYDLSLIVVLSLIFFLIFLYFKFCGLFKSYYLLTSNSSAERTKRLLLNDTINIFLIFLRIFLC